MIAWLPPASRRTLDAETEALEPMVMEAAKTGYRAAARMAAKMRADEFRRREDEERRDLEKEAAAAERDAKDEALEALFEAKFSGGDAGGPESEEGGADKAGQAARDAVLQAGAAEAAARAAEFAEEEAARQAEDELQYEEKDKECPIDETFPDLELLAMFQDSALRCMRAKEMAARFRYNEKTAYLDRRGVEKLRVESEAQRLARQEKVMNRFKLMKRMATMMSFSGWVKMEKDAKERLEKAKAKSKLNRQSGFP